MTPPPPRRVPRHRASDPGRPGGTRPDLRPPGYRPDATAGDPIIDPAGDEPRVVSDGRATLLVLVLLVVALAALVLVVVPALG